MDAERNLLDADWPVMHPAMKERLCAPVHNVPSLLDTCKLFQPRACDSMHRFPETVASKGQKRANQAPSAHTPPHLSVRRFV